MQNGDTWQVYKLYRYKNINTKSKSNLSSMCNLHVRKVSKVTKFLDAVFVICVYENQQTVQAMLNLTLIQV